MSKRFEVGDVARLVARYLSQGVEVDPTTVRISTRSPSGAETTLTYGVDDGVERLGVGHYRCLLALDEEGTWHWRWHSEGCFASAAEGQILVAESAFA